MNVIEAAHRMFWVSGGRIGCWDEIPIGFRVKMIDDTERAADALQVSLDWPEDLPKAAYERWQDELFSAYQAGPDERENKLREAHGRFEGVVSGAKTPVQASRNPYPR